MDLLKLNEPTGDAFVFLVLFAVVLGGPLVVEKLKVPGIIGLFLGGVAVGPHGLGLIGPGNTMVFSLGTLGLLYLMFVAGLELDLDLVRRHRRAVVIFSIVSFCLPMAAGTLAGFSLGFGPAAAILLGALLASHTLIVYPTLKAFRLGSEPSVATGVGATIVTDTLALIVLAVVVGSTEGDATGAEVAAQTGLGLLIVVSFTFVLLPRLARVILARFGSSRTTRYVFALVALLAAATVAEVVDIEGIIGAFFAGLALNRLVPNEGDLMHRIDFFGAAVFVPVFIVSVGLVLDPGVMAEPETLKMVGMFALACLGGKALAAALTRPLLGYSWPQVGVLFSLTAAQAAATLAVADVGRKHGLFGNGVFNAVLGLILVSLVVASVVGTYFGRRLPVPGPSAEPKPGRRVLLIVPAATEFRTVVAAVALRLAATDGGIVVPMITAVGGEALPERHQVVALETMLTGAGIDLPLAVGVDRSPRDSITHAMRSSEASAVVVDDPDGSWLSALQAEVSAQDVPVLLVGAGGRRSNRVVVRSGRDTTGGRAGLALSDIARRLAPRRGQAVVEAETPTADLETDLVVAVL